MLEASVADALLTRTASTAPARRRTCTEALKPMTLVSCQPTQKEAGSFRAIDLPTASGRLPFAAACAGTGRVDSIV